MTIKKNTFKKKNENSIHYRLFINSLKVNRILFRTFPIFQYIEYIYNYIFKCN